MLDVCLISFDAQIVRLIHTLYYTECHILLINLYSHEEAHERAEKGLMKEKKFQCDQCGKQLESKFRLREHVALTHEKRSMDIKCTECELVFVHKRQMVHHRNLVHFPDRCVS